MVIPGLSVRPLLTLLLASVSFAVPSFAGGSVYNFTLPSIDGEPTSLSSYKGKVILLVNVASRCGFTPQYSALESLYEKYKDQGFVILGFPANNFGGAGARHECGDQELLHAQVQRHFSHVCQGLGERRRYHSPLSISHPAGESQRGRGY